MSAAPPPKSSLYTRTGDCGQSSTYTGERRPKADALFAALGDVDELACALGVAREHLAGAGGGEGAAGGLAAQLAQLQSRLVDVGSAVATPAAGATPAQAARCAFPSATALPWLEGLIDTLDAALPPLMQFILPSGGPAAAQLHVARAVCRRAERAVVPLLRSVEDGGTGLDPSVAAFLNRASDYLFAAARTAAAAAGRPEETYKKAG